MTGTALARLAASLTPDQARAREEIEASIAIRRHHLLTGGAGSGKTTLIQVIAAAHAGSRDGVLLAGPTHASVGVLAKKLKAAGIAVECRTIQSALSLAATVQGDRLIFTRRKHAPPVAARIILIDEAYMIGADLFEQIDLYLIGRAVVFIGDPAQIPPVGETISPVDRIQHRSHLDTIVRHQGPILEAAHIVRRSQGGPIDWSWLKQSVQGDTGVYMPGDRADGWLRRAFTAPEFQAEPDRFVYACWTNQRVADVNAKIRAWRYGDNIPTPFMPGERILLREPVIADGVPLINTNDEVKVITIGPSERCISFAGSVIAGLDGWDAAIPVWRCAVETDEGLALLVDIVRDAARFNRALNRLRAEARVCRDRWHDFHEFKSAFAVAQSASARTVHTLQGATVRGIFVDVPDIRRRVPDNLLEAQQLFYTANTRPTHLMIPVGVSAQ